MKTPSEDVRKRLLDGGFDYEARMMVEALAYINPDGSVPNIILVGLLTHIRNIYEFFYGSGKGNKAYAGHYIGSWKNKKAPLKVKKWYIQINNYLSHLSYERVTGKYELYPINTICGHLLVLVKDFLNELPDKYMTTTMKELSKGLRKR